MIDPTDSRRPIFSKEPKTQIPYLLLDLFSTLNRVRVRLVVGLLLSEHSVGVGEVTHRLVEVTEVGGEDEGGDEASNGEGSVRPDKVGIIDDLGASELNSV